MAKTKDTLISEIAEAKEMLENPALSADEKQFAEDDLNELEKELEELTEKIEESKEEIISTPVVTPKVVGETIEHHTQKKEFDKKEAQLLIEIADYEEMLTNPVIDASERAFAEGELRDLRAQLSILEGDKEKKNQEIKEEVKVIVETSKKENKQKAEVKKKGKKKIDRDISLSTPKVIKVPKKRGRKPKAINSDISDRKKISKVKRGYPMLDALRINSLFTRQFGRILRSKNIAYSILGNEGKYTIYVINHHNQLTKAYDTYASLASENDMKVKKSEIVTVV